MFDHQEKAFFFCVYLKILNMVDRLKYETVSEAGNDSNSTFIFIYTNWMLIIENLSAWQVSSCLIFHKIKGISAGFSYI